MKKMGEALIIQALIVPYLVLILISNKPKKLRLSGKLLQQLLRASKMSLYGSVVSGGFFFFEVMCVVNLSFCRSRNGM